jgi:hypothetical protein
MNLSLHHHPIQWLHGGVAGADWLAVENFWAVPSSPTITTHHHPAYSQQHGPRQSSPPPVLLLLLLLPQLCAGAGTANTPQVT